MKQSKTFLAVLLAATFFTIHLNAQKESDDGFVALFDGKTLNGWSLIEKKGSGYLVRNGELICPPDGGGDLFSDKEYSNFILRLEFKLTPGANNGVGLRAPKEKGQIGYIGMEVQVLDDSAPEYAHLKVGQNCGSVYRILPATRGAVKKPGEWNIEEITAIGRQIKVVLNGKTIVDGNLNDVHDPEILGRHPGMWRDQGRIAFLGHNSEVAFRNIRIKELPSISQPDNVPPEGFKALFNGHDLIGWKGLVENPPKRAKMSAGELAAAQVKADERMREGWKVENGALVFSGKGDSLCTTKDYGDFELLVDWKIPPKGDSGIYLRGSPQVQIWETNSPGQFKPPDGSGGLYNNQKNPRHPSKLADHPVGEWNRFRILMVGEKVHVFLNNELVVDNVTMENYWERDKPIYPSGQIELQNHGGPLWFKNVFVREISRDAAKTK